MKTKILKNNRFPSKKDNFSSLKVNIIFVYSDKKSLRIATILERKLFFRFREKVSFHYFTQDCPKKKKLFMQIVPLTPLNRELGEFYSQLIMMQLSLNKSGFASLLKETLFIDSILLERN